MCQTVILMIPGTWAHTNTVLPVVLLMRAAALRCVADGVIFNLRLAPTCQGQPRRCHLRLQPN
jgi:hypothetical protein